MTQKTIDIEIKNCKNIDTGKIKIEKNKLNIKLGINGTGKSTTAEAINCKVSNNESALENLLPFKLRTENPDDLSPEVLISEEINSISIFNEQYVKNFLFKQDELVSNSFDIFIKSPKYIELEKNIEKQLAEIKKVFLDNEELEKIIGDFESLSKSFKTTQNGLSDSSAIVKGLENGNKITNIPQSLSEYRPFIQNSKKCVSWLDWQMKGGDFTEGHDNCPYCVSPTDSEKKEKIKSISETYNKNVIKNFIQIIEVLEKLGDYFSPNTKSKLDEILQKTEGLLPEEKDYIIAVKSQIENFLERLKQLKTIGFSNLKNNEKIEEKIQNLIIKIDEVFDKLKSDKTEEIVNAFNSSLQNTLQKITDLKSSIGKQNSEIKKLIRLHEKNINQFLINAGYKYKVIIKDSNQEYKIKLQHTEFENEISGGEQHLSYGERNAFALVLFMYESLSKNTNLIILDDPISSFDKNKKYAILQMLFREEISFKGKTVLMLTHDIEPIIDSIKALSRKFKDQTNASFIECIDGNLQEKDIKKDDILTFPQICEVMLNDKSMNIISKLVYLRRNFEILNDKGDQYQLLSDLLHKRTRDEAKAKRVEITPALTEEEFEASFSNGEVEIKKLINQFDYDKVLELIIDTPSLVSIYETLDNGYEKLQLFRIINGDFTKNDDFSDVMKKFINETYHIENDFIHQLNPKEFNLIPEFIIKECDTFINS